MLFKSHLTREEKVMKAIRASLLVLALCVCTYAGDMPCERTGVMPTEKIGEMPSEKTSAIDPVTDIALQILQSLLPLF